MDVSCSTTVDSQAVSFLNEKDGVSLSSIRKWILAKYPDTKEKQKASFNSLTIKVRTPQYNPENLSCFV